MFYMLIKKQDFYRPPSRGDNTFDSVSVCVRVCVHPFVCWELSSLNRLTFDFDFWHENLQG